MTNLHIVNLSHYILAIKCVHVYGVCACVCMLCVYFVHVCVCIFVCVFAFLCARIILYVRMCVSVSVFIV